jgi:5-amino-6-(5-phospho-D-ribitylamino)uracil phosphatase
MNWSKPMQLQNKYLISIDIDGTIIKHDGSLTKTTKTMIDKLSSQGHIVVIATGRRYSHALPIYESLSLQTPLITESGARIDHPYDKTFKPYSITFDKPLLTLFLNQTKPYLRSLFYTVNDISYGFQFDKEMIKETCGIHVSEAKQITLENQPLPYGMMVFVDKVNHQKFIELINNQFNRTIGLRSWGSRNEIYTYEVYLKHISKATAVEYLLNLYNMPKSAWMSFGDSSNDIEMLAEAKYGIAMKNAEPMVQSYANDITTHTNDEDGVAKYLMNFFKIG